MKKRRQATREATQPPDRATVAAGFVAGLLSGARSRGVQPGALLRQAGLPAALLTRRGARLPIADYSALYNLTVETLGDEAFGLFPAPMRPGAFEFLCRSALGRGNLHGALERATRFLGLVLPDMRVGVERRRGRALLTIDEASPRRLRRDDPRRVFSHEWLLRLVHGLACWLVARPIPLDGVEFPYRRPPHAADYALIYTEHSRFDSAQLVAVFDAAFLDLPLRRDESDLAAFLEGGPGRIAMLYRRDREAVRVLREHLAATLATGSSLDGAARALGISARTLHRRLREEGATFRTVRDAVRRQAALERLERTGDPISSIAADLGYSEPSAFFRAFVGWTGLAPSEYRRRDRGRGDARVNGVA
jgi:AraC-like DNA-binding protein